jgi:hypothetical protein
VCSAAFFAVACGSSSPSAPSAPSPVNAASINVTGTWVEKAGGSLAFQLQQTGTTVTGTADFVDRNAVFGAYTASGTLSGTISGSVLTMSEVYQVTSQTSGVSIAGCTENVTSTWTFTSATEMTGPFSQTDTCNGTVVFTKSGSATVIKP